MNMTCRSLVPPVVPKVRSTEVVAALTSKNTLRILNTIKPVTRAFTAMDRVKLVIYIGLSQEVEVATNALLVVRYIARDNKLKSPYQIKID